MKVLHLQVGVPSHCALLEKQTERLACAMAGTKFLPPQTLYVDSRNGRELRGAESIREDLATNMAYPARWHDATAVMYERGVRLFVELPPGRVLTALVAAAFPDARAIACAETRIDSICVHGDSPNAVAMATAVRSRLEQDGIALAPFRPL